MGTLILPVSEKSVKDSLKKEKLTFSLNVSLLGSLLIMLFLI